MSPQFARPGCRMGRNVRPTYPPGVNNPLPLNGLSP
jgi:hypothetical protein